MLSWFGWMSLVNGMVFCVLSSIGKVEFDIFDVLSLKTGPMITNHCIK